mmetsp:Transcript_96735/g.153075  ORF Transcript_96735/g.153075 Transcript_96735/m.153075 type:complete len:206 (+) Transcript_96735:97-714(+)
MSHLTEEFVPTHFLHIFQALLWIKAISVDDCWNHRDASFSALLHVPRFAQDPIIVIPAWIKTAIWIPPCFVKLCDSCLFTTHHCSTNFRPKRNINMILLEPRLCYLLLWDDIDVQEIRMQMLHFESCASIHRILTPIVIRQAKTFREVCWLCILLDRVEVLPDENTNSNFLARSLLCSAFHCLGRALLFHDRHHRKFPELVRSRA